MFKIFKQIIQHFLKSNTFQQGAALAYYTVFSLLPMIVVVVSVLGVLFGKSAVAGEIYSALKDGLGESAALQLQDIIKNQHTKHNNILTTIAGFAVLALSASGMFNQIHNAFNSIWQLKERPKSGLIKYLLKHAIAFTILISVFFIILLSTTCNSFLTKHYQHLNDGFKALYYYEHGISMLALSLAFMLLFKYLGDAIVHWKVAFLGGLFTALLFSIGKIGIGMYIGRSHLASTFGSASVLALLMLWVYYTSQIIFLGASFVEVMSEKLGCKIVPNTYAVKIEHIELEKQSS